MANEFCDISAAQRGADLTKYPYSRIAIKATEQGPTYQYENPYWSSWRAIVRQRGIELWPYHFAVASTDPVASAKWFLQVAQLSAVETPALDLEWAPANYPQWANGEQQRFLNAWAAEVARPFVLYIPVQWADFLVLPKNCLGLWLPDYQGTPTHARMIAHQKTNVATVAGIPGQCDLNDYFGEDMPLTSADSPIIEAAVAAALSGDKVFGTTSFAATMQSIASTLDAVYNKVNALASAPPAAPAAPASADSEAIAKAVAAELASLLDPAKAA